MQDYTFLLHLALKEAMLNGDVDRIQTMIDTIRCQGLLGRLQAVVREAEQLIASLRRLEGLKMGLLGMDKATMVSLQRQYRSNAGSTVVNGNDNKLNNFNSAQAM